MSGLSAKQITELCGIITPNEMETFALGYLGLETELVNRLKQQHYANLMVFSREILDKWKKQNPGQDQVQKLSALCHQSAKSSNPLVDPDKVDAILGKFPHEGATQQNNNNNPPPGGATVGAAATGTGAATASGSAPEKKLTDQMKVKMMEYFDDEPALRIFATQLKVKENKVNVIMQDKSSSAEARVFAVIKEWRKTQGNDVEAFVNMRAALVAMGRSDVVGEVLDQ